MKYDFLNPTKQLVVLLDSRVVKLDNRPDAVVCVRVVDRALGWAEDDASQPLRVLAQLVRHRLYHRIGLDVWVGPRSVRLYHVRNK